jgi:DNA-directed RNA polymerase specialized sigma24 family protein
MLDKNVLELLEKENASVFDNTEERSHALTQCLKKLSSQDQEFLKLKYADSFTLKKLAQRFGFSVTSVYRNSCRIHGLLLGCIRRVLGVET